MALGADVEEVGPERPAGVVHQHVHVAVPLLDLGHERADRLGIPHVELARERLASDGLDLGGGGVHAGDVAVADRQVRPEAARATAVASPIPWAAPVTTATRSVRRRRVRATLRHRSSELGQDLGFGQPQALQARAGGMPPHMGWKSS